MKMFTSWSRGILLLLCIYHEGTSQKDREQEHTSSWFQGQGLTLGAASAISVSTTTLNASAGGGRRQLSHGRHARGVHRHDLVLLAYLTHADSLNFWTYLEPSLRLFWPSARVVAVLDDEPRDRRFAATLPPHYGVHFSRHYLGRQVNHKLRSELMKFHADEATDAAYVGFVDSDTLFTTWVLEDTLFVGRKPRLIAGAGASYDSPFWRPIPGYTHELLGGRENLTCMLQFPEVTEARAGCAGGEERGQR